jgi:hypothetical protein
MKKTDVMHLLSRPDKWYLGGGNRLLWAPTFPLFLDKPGFWDEAHYYNVELKPSFTWTVLDEEGNEIALDFINRNWNPASMTQHYKASKKSAHTSLRIVEEKSVLSSDVAVCNLSFKNTGRRRTRINLVAWTVQEHFPSKESSWVSDLLHDAGGISFKKYVRPSVHPHIEIVCALGMSTKVRSFSLNVSERTPVRPEWSLTPWFGNFTHGRLPGGSVPAHIATEGLIYAALHTVISLGAGEESQAAIAFAASPSADHTQDNLRAALRQPDPIDLSRLSWKDHLASVPYFECSDEFLNTYYWYRWYGLRLNTQFGNEGNYRRPFASEGIGYFRAPISYSSPCHMLENRWMHDPELAQGSLLTFIDNQRDDGGFRGYIDMNYYRQEMFYHARWGEALLQLQAVHPSVEYLEMTYEGLRKYVSYFDRERDEEVSGLYDIDNHYETGQEYMHRYTVVNPKADEEHWGEVFRLKGVDVTVYVYELKRAMAAIAERLGKNDDAELWKIEAARIKTAVREKMWDPGEAMFFDIDPSSGQRTHIKAATCFYPYFTDIVEASHLPGLKRHLFNKKEFWTPFPVPSSSKDDEYFAAQPEWKGKRVNCPWNGRVWPMTNSHIAEALAQCAIRFDDSLLRGKTAEFITRFIRMMFFDNDARRPNCFEHYNPLTGTPSVYRGIDDYQHSWVNDLIIKYVCGVRPEEFSVVIDPFPFDVERVFIDDVLIRGRRLRVEIRGRHFTVWLDGSHHAESVIGKPIQIQI